MHIRMKTALGPLVLLGAFLRRLGLQREGGTAILFAFAAIPVIIGAGIAIDAARAYMVKIRLATALDAAALAVGSESSSATEAQLWTDFQNFFYDNYCKAVPTGTSVTSCTSTVATENNITLSVVGGEANITAANVTYTAAATVPTTFLKLTGVLPGLHSINSLTVTVTAATSKFPGMEIAVVLDNTGSMLCGPTDDAPNYSDSACAGNVVTSDTTCAQAPSPNESRICTLIAATKDFVSTLEAASPGAQTLYMGIVPYVTTVNVGYNSVANATGTSTLCTSSNTCSDFTTDATSGDYTDERGNILPTIPVTGNITSGSTSVSSMTGNTYALLAGMNIFGPGIPAGTTISSVTSSTAITLSKSATFTSTGAPMVAGPLQGTSGSEDSYCSAATPAGGCATVGTSYTYSDNIDDTVPSTCTLTATLTKSSTSVTVTSTGTCGSASGWPSISGWKVTSSSKGGMTTPDSITGSYSGGKFTVSTSASAAETGTTLTLQPSTTGGGTTTNNSSSITNLTSANTSPLKVGMVVTDNSSIISCGQNAVPANTYLTAVNTTSLTMSNNATATTSNDCFSFSTNGAYVNGTENVTLVSLPSTPAVGDVVVGNDIPANTTITATGGTFSNGTGTLTLSQNATGTTNTPISFVTPMLYSSSFNSGTATANWGGCIVEPTSSDENSSVSGVINSSTTDPDETEPSGGWPNWYPLYWFNSSDNSWNNGGVKLQNTSTETQGTVVGTYDQLPSPNAGCPIPILPLQDITSTAGQTAVNSELANMWPKDSAGTQVAEGMIWGWRLLSPSTPFATNNGHPYSYSQSTQEGWKKIIVLMTDGTEEWPETYETTGLGILQDGKLGTNSSTSTAETNEGTRLTTLCNNVKASTGNYTIYTIGLGSDGASNSSLKGCASQTSYFYAAQPSTLNTIFQEIAQSIIELRLTQ